MDNNSPYKPSSRYRPELIKRVAERMQLHPSTIEAVVTHQFKGIIKALTSPETTSVEMSGFGKWMYLTSRAKKTCRLFEDELERRRTNQPSKIPAAETESLEKDLAYIKNQLEYVRKTAEANSRGVGKRDSEKGQRGGDSQSQAADLRDVSEQFKEQEGIVS